MSKNEFYEVDGMDKFVPVELISICDTSCHIQINTPSGTRDLVVDKAYSFPKTPKVVVPKFVAEWVEWCRENSLTLSETLAAKENIADELQTAVSGWLTDNSEELLARAWLDGYEVEKEKLYWVRNKKGYSLLHRASNGFIESSGGNSIDFQKKHRSRYTFTEKAIKNYDERYWAFAVSVEEE